MGVAFFAVVFGFAFWTFAYELNNQCASLIWGAHFSDIRLEVFSLPLFVVLGLSEVWNVGEENE